MQFWIWIQEIKIWIWNQDFACNSHSFGPILLNHCKIIPYGTRRNWLDFGENALLDLDVGRRVGGDHERIFFPGLGSGRGWWAGGQRSVQCSLSNMNWIYHPPTSHLIREHLWDFYSSGGTFSVAGTFCPGWSNGPVAIWAKRTLICSHFCRDLPLSCILNKDLDQN